MAVYLEDLEKEGVIEVWRLEIGILDKTVTILAAVETWTSTKGEPGFNCSITSQGKGSGVVISSKFVLTEKEAVETLMGLRYSLEITLKLKNKEPIKFLEDSLQLG